MIKIQLKLRSEVIMESKYLWLDPYATNTTRIFVFYGARWFIGEEEYRFESAFTVCISYFKINSQSEYYTEFNIFLKESYGFCESEWRVSGLISNDEYDYEYRQGMTEVFKLWEDGKDIDWFSLMKSDHLKKDYFLSCLFFSGINDEITEKNIYELDMTFVKEESDFLYLAGLAFLGSRAYMGYDLYTFEDCLLTFFHKRGRYFNDVKIIFSNTNILPPDVTDIFMKAVSVLKKFKFEIVEK